MRHDYVDIVWDWICGDGFDAIRGMIWSVESVVVVRVGKSPGTVGGCVGGDVDVEFGSAFQGEGVRPFVQKGDAGFGRESSGHGRYGTVVILRILWSAVIVALSRPVDFVELQVVVAGDYQL